MSNNDYGFTTPRKSMADKLRKITPSGNDATPEPSELEKADAASAALGFIPRESSRVTVLRRRKEIGPTVAINMRVPEAVASRFINFCEQHRLSYWEGVDELMKRGKVE